MYKQRIIEKMLQAARVRELGYFLDDAGFMNILSMNDIDFYAEEFLREAYSETVNLLRHMASVDREVE